MSTKKKTTEPPTFFSDIKGHKGLSNWKDLIPDGAHIQMEDFQQGAHRCFAPRCWIQVSA